MLPPQLVRPCEVIRGVHIEEEQVGIGQRPDPVQGEDTDSYQRVEADGAKVTLVQTGGDCRAHAGP